MQKRRIFINAIMSLVQIVLVGGVLFYLYRFLLKTIGVEQFGIWSLVLATTSVTQIANLGLSGSVVKFVAKYVARGEYKNVSSVIQTATISLSVIVGLILLVSYPLIKWILGLVMTPDSLGFAFEILPFALFSLWLSTLTGIFQSGLDGFQRIYIRNLLVMGGSVFFAILCFILAPEYGLIGLAYAQIINNSVILIISWILIKSILPALPIIPYQWDRNLFKEIISYGINFQIISVTTMFYDPITKALLSKFGGLSIVGYYEMANRMVQQFRALIVYANQVLVPVIADLQEKDHDRIRAVYSTNNNLIFYLALPLFTLIITSIPLISEIWIGHYERIFVVFGILLSIAWFFNTLNVPAYIANMGTGDLRWNVIGTITHGILNAFLGVILGVMFNGFGVVVARVIAISLGGGTVYVAYHLTHRLPLSELFPEKSRAMFAFCIIILLASFFLQREFNHVEHKIIMNSLMILLFSLVIFIPFWLHPMRKCLMGWIINDLLNREAKA